MLEWTSGLDFYGINKNTQNKFQFGDYVRWFPKGKKYTWENLRKDGLVYLGYNIAYPIILFFLFVLTILNQVQYWSMLTSSNHRNMWVKHWKGFKVQRMRCF
jgi:hypothetical protein